MPILTTTKPARCPLWLLLAVFILPFAIGSGLFWSGWRPERIGNHGELLQPPRHLPGSSETGLRHADGRPLPVSELRGKWLLVLPVTGNCDASCQSLLQRLHQLHVALNKEQKRLQRVLISTEMHGPASDPALLEVQRQFPDLVVAAVNGEMERTVWSKTLESPGQTIFVVDPLGNVMMRYVGPTDMRGMLKDLERLLKYSWIR